MQTKGTPMRKSPKLSVTMPPDMVAWLRKAAANQRVSFSTALRIALLPAFNSRRAK